MSQPTQCAVPEKPGQLDHKTPKRLEHQIGLKFLVDVKYEDYSISAIFASDPQFTSTEVNSFIYIHVIQSRLIRIAFITGECELQKSVFHAQ